MHQSIAYESLSTPIPSQPLPCRLELQSEMLLLAKPMVCSITACAKHTDTSASGLLATGMRQSQPMDIRLSVAAGLTAIAAWSGPRTFLKNVDTYDEVASMTSMTTILIYTQDRNSNLLRTAAIDGLIVMLYRPYARRIFRRHGTDEKIETAARIATISGDYTVAVKSTAAAGQRAGRSIDE